jgi:hypothetical protein
MAFNFGAIMIINRRLIKFYVFWNAWSVGKTVRLNSSMWGYDPYTSYRLGPFEMRIYGTIV